MKTIIYLIFAFFLFAPVLNAQVPICECITDDPCGKHGDPDCEETYGCNMNTGVQVGTQNCGTSTNACNGDSTGSITLTPSGGTPPYSYDWSNGGSGPNQTNLPAGPYTIEVTESGGCKDTVNVILTEPPPIVVTPNITDAPCPFSTGGSATVNVTGGCGAYGIVWSNFQTGNSAFGLSPGNYTVSVTDANGCNIITPLIVGHNDTIPPVALCMNIPLVLDPGGNASITPAAVDAGSFDNCGISNISLSQTNFTNANVGTNAVILTVTDQANLTSTCSANVIVFPNCVPLVVNVFTDNQGFQTSWTLVDNTLSQLIHQQPPGSLGSNQPHTNTFCVPPTHCYTFTIFDAAGNGICCANGNGNYSVVFDGNLIVAGGPFANMVQTPFGGPGCPGGPPPIMKGNNSAASQEVIFEVYPNPFEAITTIRFSIPEDANLSLDLLDMKGRQISSIWKGETRAGKEYNVQLDASDLPAGMYMLRLEDGEGLREVKSLVHLR